MERPISTDAELQELKSRLAEAESRLRRLKLAVICVAVLLVALLAALLIPPIGLVLAGLAFVAVVVGGVLAYMGGVIWVLERLTAAGNAEFRRREQATGNRD